MATADDAAAQLWAAVRGFSDAELRRAQRSVRRLLRARDAREDPAPDGACSPQDAAVELQLGAKTQRVRADDFVHVFLDHLHGQVQQHADARVSADGGGSETNMATPESNMATLQDEDQFPQLMRTQSNGQVAPAKTPKRRITTTLLTPKDSTVVARPVPVAISFPPLGASEGTRPPAWAKQSLLERRMGSSTSTFSTSSASSGAATPSAWGPKKSVQPQQPMAWGSTNSLGGAMNAPPVATTIAPKKKGGVDSTTSRPPQQLSARKKSNQVTHLQPRSPKKSRVKLNENQLAEEGEAPVVDKSSSVAKKVDVMPEPERSSDEFQVNKQAAKLYGFLIKERFVKSTSAELQVLISLLYRADCAACGKGGGGQPEKATSCGEPSEFCWRVHCLDFAEMVFLEIEPVLAHLGTDLLGLVKHSLRDAEGICSLMLERLDEVSRRREEFRVAESARIGCQLPIEMKASAVRDFAIPFNEETDSRLHFRTPEESLLYTNREKVRDGFLGLLRQFQQKQHSLVGIENAGVAAAAIAAARELLSEVSPENRWWFAKFFVQELVQVGSNPFGESDKDLVLKIMADKLVVKNPDRLRKLHRRFSSQKPTNKSPQAQVHATGGGSNNNNTRPNSKVNNNSLRKTRQDIKGTTSEDDATKSFTATLDRMRSFFTDNQLFFFHFLHSCDSYEFSELVKHQLERQFYAIRDTMPASADARKDFTEVVLRLKVVAKFLGYLRFSPQWQVTCSIRQLSAHNAAFKAVEREGISTLEVARDSSLDVKKLLEDSILESSISKCIPWLCDYLSMLSLDKLSFGTTYFKQLVVLLHLLLRSSRLNALGETGFYVALQIERIFRVLKLDAGFLLGEDYQSGDLLPSSPVRLALASEDDLLPESGAGEDHLPFLYSQVFVQSCVSELEDLRGFIQTRAQPTPRRKLSIGSGTMITGHPVALMRKLRPLQVVIEDDHGVDSTSSFVAKHSNVVRAASPGMKSPATGFPSSFPPVLEENDELSEAVFKVHPKLKTVVEFVVGSVTTDICEHVMAHVVTPRADGLVDRCASESGLLTIGRSPAAVGEDAALAARASFQMMITSKTRHEANFAVVASLQEALRLGEERISAAVPPFIPPPSHPTLTNSIVFVALQRTRGALKSLVPKSCQTEFVKRVAFRNKSLLKDLGAGSKVAAVALPSTAVGAATSRRSDTEATNLEDKQRRLEDQRLEKLKRCSAAIFKNASSKSASLEIWERQVAILSQCLDDFSSSLSECVQAGDVTQSATSALKSEALALWDLVWRAVTSCLKFWGSSLDVFAACELILTRAKRVQTVEGLFNEFVVGLTQVLSAAVECIGEGSAVSRVQSTLTFVLDYVMGLPCRLPTTPEHVELVKRFAVQGSSQVVMNLRSVVSAQDSDRRLELNWEQWAEPRQSLQKAALSPEARFRLDVWNAVASATTTAA
ncbi:AAA ATPase domain-containing protein [Phytophthora cinnamomi]|uniref:AAA ATPase domain-containing protein n=1 Tax=Phytophthora cinnamomi TaxID=4785 RepID=UPI003559C171|nr:AAA ATPase domain-containing protein [Phytophthora cinnamomi]